MKGRRRLATDCRGASAVEFAVVAPALLLTVFFIMGIAMILWTKAAMQTAAASLARCSAIGSSACSNPTTYASTILTNWGASGLLINSSASVTAATTCSSAPGHYSLATVTGTGYTVLFYSIPGKTITATACFPSSAT